MALWVRATGLVLVGIHLALLLALSIGRAQTDVSSILAYVGRYQGPIYHTYLLDVQHHQSVRLSRYPFTRSGPAYYPIWSLDGRFLAYHEEFNYRQHVLILDLQTGHTHLLADDRAGNLAWLPTDTPQLVYASPMANALQTFNPLTRETTWLMDCPMECWTENAMIWSPDGVALSVWRQSDHVEIHRINPDDATIVNLTPPHSKAYDPAWSPDYKWIAFTASRNGSNYNIYVMDRNGEQVRSITHSTTDRGNPLWSPDGRSLAFVGLVMSGNYQIYVTDIKNRITRNLAQTHTRISSLAWSPDGQQMAFLARQNGRSQIYLIDADGKNQRPLVTGAAEYVAPVWRPVTTPAP